MENEPNSSERPQGGRGSQSVVRALVLAQQELTVGGAYDYWDDLTGERFHFPNTYRHKMAQGLPFVYYRGTRRASGKSGTPEYFGTGRIGRVWRDGNAGSRAGRHQRWYCNVVDYVPFVTPVSWVDGGHPIETIPRNVFRNAVRALPLPAYRRILRLAGVASPAVVRGALASMPPLIDVVPVAASPESSLLASIARRSLGIAGEVRVARRSDHAALIGRRAELVGLEFLTRLSPSPIEVVDVAGRGESPGWDLEYVRASGQRLLVEVKGTTASRFAAIEITANEWRAARANRDQYLLMLVADCLSSEPVVELVLDPFGKYESGAISAEPAVFRLCRPQADS